MNKTLLTLLLACGVLTATAQTVEHTLRVEKPADCTTSIYLNLEMENVSVYPNPVTDVLNIPLLKTDRKIVLLLMNVDGKVLLEKTLNALESRYQLSLVTYPAGIYFVQVIDSQKRTFKIIKK